MGRMGWVWIPALMLSIQAGAANVAAQEGRPATVRDMVRIVTPISAEIAPDGSAVLYERVVPDPEAGTFGVSIWRVPAGGGAGEELVAGGTLPRWSPDGRHVAFLARAGARSQLWRIRADGTDRVQLTSGETAPLDLAWSRDGGRIAFIAVADSLPQIHVVEVGTGEVRRITDVAFRVIVHPWDPGANLGWSPDGRWIAFAGKPSQRFDDDYRSDIYVVEVGTGAVRAVVRREGMDMRPVWSPDGSRLAFRTTAGRLDRFTDHGLAIVDVASGRILEPSPEMQHGFLDGPYAYGWRSDGRTLLYTAAVPAGVGVFSLDAASGASTRLDGGPGVHGALSVATNADHMAFVRSDPSLSWEVFVSPASRYGPTRLTHLNPQLDDVARARAEIVRWQSGGDSISGVLYVPADLDRSRRYPTVTVVHGGPEGQGMAGFHAELPSPRFTLDGTLYPPHLFTGRGFIVFVPNFRGSGGHGTALRRAGGRDWSRAFLEDIDAGLDHLIARGLADSTRLYLLGSRSGATKVVSLLTNTQRFRAAFAHAPYPDLVAEYEAADGDFRLMHEGLMGGSPSERPEAWARHSPIEHVDRIRTPLLLVTEEDTFGIPSRQALELHRRLWEARVPGELILYRGRTLADSEELLRRVVAWFER